jgi:uncharacterized membrane protein YbhN (UPF0104 family)
MVQAEAGKFDVPLATAVVTALGLRLATTWLAIALGLASAAVFELRQSRKNESAMRIQSESGGS